MKKGAKNQMLQEFYQNLGRLFYAMAAADKVVRKEEVDTLQEVVRKEWLDPDDGVDAFGTDAAFQIEIIFDWMDAHKPDAGASFQTFSEYYKNHQEFFTDEMEHKILKTAREIGASFRDLNKSELVLMAQLESLFKQ